MDIKSTIAAVSVIGHQNQLRQSVDIAVTKMAMDAQETAAVDLIESLKESTPSFGYKLDIRV
jgi:hypothetical protein